MSDEYVRPGIVNGSLLRDISNRVESFELDLIQLNCVRIDIDPYTLDPTGTLRLVETYFNWVDSTSIALYPRKTFTNWIQYTPQKSVEELSTLYAMLALAAAFSGESTLEFRSSCVSAIEDAQTILGTHLCSSHICVLLSLYGILTEDDQLAWQSIEASLEIVTALGYRNEEVCIQKEGNAGSREVFGFTSAQLAECKRRTFWTAFIIDRVESWVVDAVHTVDVSDIFVRLPMDDDGYEQGSRSSTPFYNNGLVDQSKTALLPECAQSTVPWFILIAAFWGYVDGLNRHYEHHLGFSSSTTDEFFFHKTHRALDWWISVLPSRLQDSATNRLTAEHTKRNRMFFQMHTFYYLARIKLYCCVRAGDFLGLPERNKLAKSYAGMLVKLLDTFDTNHSPSVRDRSADNACHGFFFSNPASLYLQPEQDTEMANDDAIINMILKNLSDGRIGPVSPA